LNRSAAARAGPIALRPQEITRSGQGGASGSLSAPSPATPRGQKRGGSQRHGARSAIVFSTKGSPTASARPTAWVTMPAMPSVRTQAVFPDIDACFPFPLPPAMAGAAGLSQALRRPAMSRGVAGGATPSPRRRPLRGPGILVILFRHPLERNRSCAV